MNLASKIWYTWLLFTMVIGLTAWVIDWDKHPRLSNILAALIVAPIAVGLIAGFVYLIIWIWKQMSESKWIWMAVDADEYELPICVEDSAKELADRFGVTDTTIYNCVKRGRSGRENGYKYLKVERRED